MGGADVQIVGESVREESDIRDWWKNLINESCDVPLIKTRDMQKKKTLDVWTKG